MMTTSYNTAKYSKYILETVGSLEYPDSLLLTQENDVHRDINHLNSFLSRFYYISRCLSLLFTLSICLSIFLILFSPSISLLHLSPMSFAFSISVFHFNSTSFLLFYHLLFLYHLLSIFSQQLILTRVRKETLKSTIEVIFPFSREDIFFACYGFVNQTLFWNK